MLENLEEALHKQPFEPFTIVTTSGDRYAVEDPGCLAMPQSRSMLHLFPPRSERWITIRTNQIVVLESAEKAA